MLSSGGHTLTSLHKLCKAETTNKSFCNVFNGLFCFCTQLAQRINFGHVYNSVKPSFVGVCVVLRYLLILIYSVFYSDIQYLFNKAVQKASNISSTLMIFVLRFNVKLYCNLSSSYTI